MQTSTDLKEFGVDVFDRWTALWNGDLGLAERIMASAFRLRYAQPGTEPFDAVHDAAGLTGVIRAWHGMRGPSLRFAAEAEAVVDLADGPGGPSGTIARPYLASYTGEDGAPVARSGIDMLRLADGRIAEVWSVSGPRRFH